MIKSVLTKVRKTKRGYVSIEILVVAALIIAMAVVGIINFNNSADNIMDNSINKIEVEANK